MRRRRRALLALPLGDADDDDDDDDLDDDDGDEQDDREAVLLIGARRGRPSADPRDYASTLARHVAAVVARLLGATASALTTADAAIVERVIADATAGLATADAASVRGILALPVDERREAVKRLVRAVTYELEDERTRTVNAPAVTDMIAQTLVHDAANQIMLGRYEDAGVTRVRWCVDGAPCPVCAADDGLVRRLGDPFPSTGVDAPPAHPRCMCCLLPVTGSGP